MRRNVIIVVSVILTTVVLYFLFRGKSEVKTPEEGVVTESQLTPSTEELKEEVAEEISSETPEEKGEDDTSLEDKKREYLKTLDKIDKYFSERIDLLRTEIAKLSNSDPKREKMEQELEKIGKEYEALKQEINKMRSEVENKSE